MHHGVGGIPELVRQGVNGLLVKPGNQHDLAAAISKLIDDGELRRRLASNARESVREYDWPVVAKKYLSFYQELAKQAFKEIPSVEVQVGSHA
jgi:glycosyltransferase involved in cell wall biosynthesis